MLALFMYITSISIIITDTANSNVNTVTPTIHPMFPPLFTIIVGTAVSETINTSDYQ